VFEVVIRAIVARLQANPEVDDSERAGLGITVPDRILTPAEIPATRPAVSVDTSGQLRHVIAFAAEATPTRKTKGVMDAEIWVKIGDPRAGRSQRADAYGRRHAYALY